MIYQRQQSDKMEINEEKYIEEHTKAVRPWHQKKQRPK